MSLGAMSGRLSSSAGGKTVWAQNYLKYCLGERYSRRCWRDVLSFTYDSYKRRDEDNFSSYGDSHLPTTQ